MSYKSDIELTGLILLLLIPRKVYYIIILMYPYEMNIKLTNLLTIYNTLYFF
jgi:hypothetical protein